MTKKQPEKADTFQRLLPVALTDDELRHRYEALHAQLDRIDEINAELQLAKEAAKEPLKTCEKRIRELRLELSTKKEHRQVDCETLKRFSERRAETVRLDTGEVVDRRPLTAQEMQTELSVIPGGKTAPSRPVVPS